MALRGSASGNIMVFITDVVVLVSTNLTRDSPDKERTVKLKRNEVSVGNLDHRICPV